MKRLSKFSRKFKTFFTLKSTDKKLLIEAFITTALARILILAVKFNKLQKFIGEFKEESPHIVDENQYRIVAKIAWVINIVSRNTPWQSRCFVQAITAQRMLEKRNISCTVYFGINKDKENKITAHAWTRCGDVIVTGNHEKDAYTKVAWFSNTKQIRREVV